MHHFFLERFFQPADWFEKRLAYTRSVAASSMVSILYFFLLYASSILDVSCNSIVRLLHMFVYSKKVNVNESICTLCPCFHIEVACLLFLFSVSNFWFPKEKL